MEESPPEQELSGGEWSLADHLDDVLVRLEHRRPSLSVVAVCCCAIAVAVGFAVLTRQPADPATVEELIPLADGVAPADLGAGGDTTTTVGDGIGPQVEGGSGEVETGGPEVPESELVVHVAGAVRRPGLVTLPSGSRIRDAIDRAGGPTSAADVHRLNLAAPAVDGMQVRVPTIDDDLAPGELVDLPPTAEQGSAGGGPININMATVEQLQTLPGIGPALAAAIAARRQEHGPFATVDDLDAVPGIGPAKLATIRDHVVV